MFRRILGLAAAIAISFGSASAQDISRQVPVTDDFGDGELSWQGLPGGYEFRVRIIVVEGIVELCGVGAFTNAQVRSTATRMLRGAQLKLNGRTVLQDFRYFNTVARPNRLNTAVANCKSTGTRVPRGNVDVDVEWPNGTFRN